MIDARLLVPAAAAWAGAVLVTTVLRTAGGAQASGWRFVWLLLATSALIALVSVVLMRRRNRRAGGLILIGVVGLVVGSLSAAAHAAALAPSPVSEWIAGRAVVTARGVVTTEAVAKRPPARVGWSAPAQREFRLATSAMAARGTSLSVDLPFLVRVPASMDAPAVGSTVVIGGRLGPSPGQSDTSGSITISTHDPRLTIESPPGVLDEVTGGMRAGLRTALTGVSADAAALVAGLAIGDESGQSAALRTQMRASGLSHLTAVSGGNVSIVVVAALGLATVVRLALVLRVAFSLLALAFFVVLVGPAPSVIRAAAMAGLVLIGMLVGGRRAGPSVLAAAVIVLVILVPGLTVTWGFALSAGATAGVTLLSAPVDRRLGLWRPTARLPPAVRDGLGVTIAAQLATLPLLVAMGSSVGWVSLPANVLAMPVVGPVTVLGLLAAMTSPMVPSLAALLAHAAAWPAAWIGLVAARCSDLPGARLPVPSGWAGVGILVLAGMAAAGLRWLIRRVYPSGLPSVVRTGAALLVASGLLAALVLPPGRRAWPPSNWLMIMCDVGQGDGLLLNAGRGMAVVVDTGPEPEAIRRCLDDAQVATLPAVVLTLFHADHVGGLEGALRDRPVGALLATPVRDPPLEAAEVLRQAAAHDLTVQQVTAGDERIIGRLAWQAVWPRRTIPSRSVPNNASIVLIVEIQGRRLLLMGDAEPEAVSALSQEIVGRRYDVIKVPHHGSRYQHPLLTTWAPAPVALISVGAGNDYGHPAASTVAAWRGIGALVARTDENGDVAVVESGSGVAVVVRRGMLPSS